MDRCFTTTFSPWFVPDFHTPLQNNYQSAHRHSDFTTDDVLKIYFWTIFSVVFKLECKAYFHSVNLWLSPTSNVPLIQPAQLC